jgi:hypothetical protein
MLVTRDADAPVLDVAGILRDAGLTPLELTMGETICAEEAPGIGRTLFCGTFGGLSKSEWPKCSKISGYEDFLCADVTLQPFMPLDSGKPGLVLRLPESSQNDKSTFHVLTTKTQGGILYYRGKYAKIPLPQLQFKWKNLPSNVCMQKFAIHVSHITSSRNAGSDGYCSPAPIPGELSVPALNSGIYGSASLQPQRSRNTRSSISTIN